MEQPSSQDIQKALSRLTHELHLGAVKSRLEEIAAQARTEGWDYHHFLCELLLAEYEQRAENAQAKRLKTAGFPQYKYMEELDLDELPEGVKPLLKELQTLEFVRQGQNAVFYGNPGTGKTHLSIALGILACKQRMTVLFTSVPHLWRPDSEGTTSSSATNSDTWPATRREGNCSSTTFRSGLDRSPLSSLQTSHLTDGERLSRTRFSSTHS